MLYFLIWYYLRKFESDLKWYTTQFELFFLSFSVGGEKINSCIFLNIGVKLALEEKLLKLLESTKYLFI